MYFIVENFSIKIIEIYLWHKNKINEIKDDKEKIEEFKQKILDEY